MICCGIAHNNMIDCNCKTRGFIYLAKLLTYTQWYVNSTQHTINLFFANDTKKNMCKCIIMAWLWFDFYHSDTTAFYDCLCCCHQPIKRLLSTFLHSVSLYYYLYLPLIAYPFLCVWILISKIPLTSSQRRHISKNVFQMSLSSHHAI